MKISEFKAKAGSGLARTNRYAVNFSLPATLSGNYDLPMILMFCERVEIPGLNVNTVPIRDYGEIREMPYEFNYDPIPMSFYVDTEMQVKKFFDDWIMSVQNPTNRNFNYYKDFTSAKLTIEVQDLNDYTKYKVELFDAYPKTVSPVTLSYEDKNIMRMQVMFAFRYWRSGVYGIGGSGSFLPVLQAGEQLSYRDGFAGFDSSTYRYNDWRQVQRQFNEYISEKANSVTGSTTGYIANDVEIFPVNTVDSFITYRR